MSTLPLITHSRALPLAREVAWDFAKDAPVWRGGEPVYVSGARAVAVWAWLAVRTTRGLHDVFTRDYGLGLAAGLSGKPYTEAVRKSEAVRYVRDCLTINPYIVGVDGISVSMDGSTLSVKCRLKTIYGEVVLDGHTVR